MDDTNPDDSSNLIGPMVGSLPGEASILSSVRLFKPCVNPTVDLEVPDIADLRFGMTTHDSA